MIWGIKLKTIKTLKKSKGKKKKSRVKGPNWEYYLYKLELKD
jgi:hypothetical protein